MSTILLLLLFVALSPIALASETSASDSSSTTSSVHVSSLSTSGIKSSYAPSSAAQETVSKLVALFINWHGDKINQAFSNQAAHYIDYELMSSMVLGNDMWSKLSAAQRRNFISAFRNLIEQRYYVRWHRIFKHGRITYAGESSSSGQVLVKTEIAVNDEVTVVNWKLRPAQGGYRVVSLTTDHRDLLEILQPRFDKVISQHGFDGLMIWLNRKAVSPSR